MADKKTVIGALGSMLRQRAVSATAVAASMLFLLASSSAMAETPSASDASDWVTDGPVYAIAHNAGRTFIGGDFTHVGPRSGAGVPLDATGAVAPPFPEVAGGDVLAAAPDGAGGWYIGGTFTSVGGIGRTRLAHIDPLGGVDLGFTPAPNGPVRAIAIGSQAPDQGTVYIGGSFTQVSGLTRNNAAALTSGGGVIKEWNPAPDNSVHALAESYLPLQVKPPDPATESTVTTPVVVMGGDFMAAGAGATAPTNHRVAAIWGVGSVDGVGAANSGKSLTGTADGSGTGGWAGSITIDGTVRTLALGTAEQTTDKQSVPVYIGGDFASPAKAVAAIPLQVTLTAANRTTTAPFSPYFGWSVAADCGPAPAPAGCAPSVSALALVGPTLYLGGNFFKVGGADHLRLAAISAIGKPSDTGSNTGGLNTSVVSPTWGTTAAPDGTIRALRADATNVYLGGDFSTVGGQSRARLAALDATTGNVTDWNPSAAGGNVNVLASYGSLLYAGGGFTSIGAIPASRIAALDSTGALDQTWHASADHKVEALALSPDGSRLYVGGAFENVSEAARAHIAALATTDGTLLDWPQAGGADGWVLALATAGSTVYAGGSFQTIAGKPRERLAAFGADGALTGWDPSADNNVYALNASCGVVYAGGSFQSAGGAERNRLVALDASDGRATDWDANANAAVYSLAAANDTLYVGGRFTLVGGARRDGIAALSRASGDATDWNPVAEDYWVVRAVALSPDATIVYAGGSFTKLADAPRSKLGALDAASGHATGWDPSMDADPDHPVYALATSGADVFAAGEFRSAGTRMQQGWASFDGGPDADLPAAPPDCPSPPPAPQPAPEPQPVPEVHTLGVVAQALVVSGFNVTPKRFVVGRTATALTAKKKRAAVGTKFRYSLSRDASVSIAIARVMPGRLAGKRCVAPAKAKRRAKRCTRLVKMGVLTRSGKAGVNTISFSGRMGKKALAPGLYRATLTAAATDGVRSAPKRATFVVQSGGRG